MLLIVGPLFWFGVHWFVGRRADPPLDLGDTVLIAGSPIAVIVGAAGLANAMAPFAWMILSRFVAM